MAWSLSQEHAQCSHFRFMAEVSFLPSANTRKRASASREGCLELATLRLLQETKKLSSGKISARYVLMQVSYSRLQLLFADQGPHTLQVADFYSGAHALSCPSQCQKLEAKYFLDIFCAEMLQQFSLSL